ncbi:hypothetical protein TNIN_318891 [Trichonephila inaurata madagascariensis]|uniref:Mos1 transposase HTH domain-containing protein n=1 Tax=Trichonephila inaurata madagascariensis TaxID=2747483 RepID=A0A8X6YVM7_9ARAC|nr:hypothetical protein TNIN_318891 [Trichonephila inaurata madagascariensis]
MLGKIGSRLSVVKESPCRNTSSRRIVERFLEQRYAINFCVKLAKTGKETPDMINEAYGDITMGISDVFEWHKLFREGSVTS